MNNPRTIGQYGITCMPSSRFAIQTGAKIGRSRITGVAALSATVCHPPSARRRAIPRISYRSGRDRPDFKAGTSAENTNHGARCGGSTPFVDPRCGMCRNDSRAKHAKMPSTPRKFRLKRKNDRVGNCVRAIRPLFHSWRSWLLGGLGASFTPRSVRRCNQTKNARPGGAGRASEALNEATKKKSVYGTTIF
jgi:hypothetical protein